MADRYCPGCRDLCRGDPCPRCGGVTDADDGDGAGGLACIAACGLVTLLVWVFGRLVLARLAA